MIDKLTPAKAAIRINKILEEVLGNNRFPVDVPLLAPEVAQIFGWSDPISEIRGVEIKGFEGALMPDESKSKWLLLYNNALHSAGRIRFTQAHELGHYILHRTVKDAFQCSAEDMVHWSKDEKDIETQADVFAAYLLMPFDDFRKQINAKVDLDLLGHCANRYGVSLTASILRWLQYTTEQAVLIMSTDGYINWAYSSTPAFQAGAFFRTSGKPIPLPTLSIAANENIEICRSGTDIPAQIWFAHADPALTLREMKISSDQFGIVLTLLHLPRLADVWPPRTFIND